MIGVLGRYIGVQRRGRKTGFYHQTYLSGNIRVTPSPESSLYASSMMNALGVRHILKHLGYP
jgi:hypothetical protein